MRNVADNSALRVTNGKDLSSVLFHCYVQFTKIQNTNTFQRLNLKFACGKLYFLS